ncbi:MAG: Asp-tRNA(Asn)/Glu-tRNA(Gln) amidotransferase subunit GatC [Spirochaetales bacterium]|nr:Asp-tRNA(Asn)/Glu-tRNA(Gln) amidotransferase subunit GatC [Leptospiraceae bacterium]MCP5481825.1 Asp-tRNA(Asn)/Glu-tRNA(Gln) amidotransferase subunit GatC [Spirochaetales bacterium]
MLSDAEFRDLAFLARLDPDDPGLQGIRPDFNRILDYVRKISELDTSAVSEGATRYETRNITRPDSPRPPADARLIARMAPQWEAGHFVVPGVIESEG